METAMIGLEMVRRMLVKAGPYLLVEAALPGGTLIALLVYWYRQRLKKSAGPCRFDTSPGDYGAGASNPKAS